MRHATRATAFWMALGLAAARTAGAAGPEGFWEGTLRVGPVDLRLVVTVEKDAKGGLKAGMVSVDQAPGTVPAEKITATKEELAFEFPAIGATFRGKLDAAGTEAVGSWTQGSNTIPLTLKKVATPTPAPVADGTWEGKIQLPGAGLRVVVRVFKGKDGARTAKFDSPDQSAAGIGVDSVAIDKDKKEFTFAIKALNGSYKGTLNPAGTEAVGTWKQNGADFPLTLKKVDKVSKANRPQTPKGPFPYAESQVSYDNAAAEVRLGGTLTAPKGPGPFPAAILITGSGAQDRDETLFEHKPFLVLADALTRRGVAVLRVDDRGVGASTGSAAGATSEDFAGDVEAGIAFLKARPEVDPARIGLIGHSEGGVIAPMVAARAPDVAFIVLLAGTGLPGDEIARRQVALMARAGGAGDDAVAGILKLQEATVAAILEHADPDAMEKAVRAAFDAWIKALPEADAKALGDPARLRDGMSGRFRSPWFRYFLAHDPRINLAKVRCPVLAVNGEKDTQVPAKDNLAAIEKALKAGGNARYAIQELPGLNHLFQTCTTGGVGEYAQIEETFAPGALKVVCDWVAATAGATATLGANSATGAGALPIFGD